MMSRRSVSSFLQVAMIALLSTGCTEKSGVGAADAASATASATGACRLLTTAQVSGALSASEPGVAETTREKYGITACEWSTQRGRFVAQHWKSDHPAAKEEASGLMLGVVDPLKPGAAKNVRYEAVSGVGDDAVAVIETSDAERGILNDMAMLVAQRGNTILVLMAPELVQRDRASALKSLETLGKSAVSRL